MRNYFILDGVDSRDFGVYISGQGTFNASARDYNVIPVPGRNGDLVGPEKRFQNGTLTYPAFIYSNFKKNVEDFRNFLLSLVGYHDLVDSYHPDEIRKVLFRGPFETEVETKNDAGRFDIVFECKPQRFLASGNEVTTFEPSGGDPEIFSGSVITFDNPGGATVNALSTAINPVQSGSGDPSPTNVRPISGWTGANIVVSPTLDAQDGTTYPVSWQTESGTVYGGTLDVLTGVLTVTDILAVVDGTLNTVVSEQSFNAAQSVFTIGVPNFPHVTKGNGDKFGAICNRFKEETFNHAVTAGYDNVFALQGNYSRNIVFRKTDLTSKTAWIDWLSVNPLQVVYKLANPFTVQLTAPQIQLLNGQNNVWADTGDITATITFPQAQFTITNPTLFDSQPLMRVYGVGALGVGSQTVTITQADVYTDIDCEMMDCFKGTANKNPYVQLTDHNFPVFKPGVNNISLGTGITKVEITPRWWIV